MHRVIPRLEPEDKARRYTALAKAMKAHTRKPGGGAKVVDSTGLKGGDSNG